MSGSRNMSTKCEPTMPESFWIPERIPLLQSRLHSALQNIVNISNKTLISSEWKTVWLWRPSSTESGMTSKPIEINLKWKPVEFERSLVSIKVRMSVTYNTISNDIPISHLAEWLALQLPPSKYGWTGFGIAISSTLLDALRRECMDSGSLLTHLWSGTHGHHATHLLGYKVHPSDQLSSPNMVRLMFQRKVQHVMTG